MWSRSLPADAAREASLLGANTLRWSGGGMTTRASLARHSGCEGGGEEKDEGGVGWAEVEQHPNIYVSDMKNLNSLEHKRRI